MVRSPVGPYTRGPVSPWARLPACRVEAQKERRRVGRDLSQSSQSPL